MNDASFFKAGRWAALAAAGLSFAYAVLVAANGRGASVASMAQAASDSRVLSLSASWILAAGGLAASLAVVGLRERAPKHGWMMWAGGLGLIGTALMTVHGLYDAFRVPVLLVQWSGADPLRQAAISAFAGMPNPVDPKGAASLLFLGAFVVVAAVSVTGPLWFQRIGKLHGAVLLAAFLSGAVGLAFASETVYMGYAWLGGLAFGVTGPLWWVAVSRVLDDNAAA